MQARDFRTDFVNAEMLANIQGHDRMLAFWVCIEPYHKALTTYVKQGDGVINWVLGQEFSLLSN